MSKSMLVTYFMIHLAIHSAVTRIM